jgi:hypothetical protein
MCKPLSLQKTSWWAASKEAAVKYGLWMEGWRWPVRQAEDASAKFLGNYEAETFADACQRWCDEKLEQDHKHAFQLNSHQSRPTFWACRIFDNEADARRFAG